MSKSGRRAAFFGAKIFASMLGAGAAADALDLGVGEGIDFADAVSGLDVPSVDNLPSISHLTNADVKIPEVTTLSDSVGAHGNIPLDIYGRPAVDTPWDSAPHDIYEAPPRDVGDWPKSDTYQGTAGPINSGGDIFGNAAKGGPIASVTELRISADAPPSIATLEDLGYKIRPGESAEFGGVYGGLPTDGQGNGPMDVQGNNPFRNVQGGLPKDGQGNPWTGGPG